MIKKVIAIFGSHLWLFPWWLSCFVLPLQVRLLLKYRADPTIENNTYKTPLHLACEFGRYKVSTSTATYQIDQYNDLFLYYIIIMYHIGRDTNTKRGQYIGVLISNSHMFYMYLYHTVLSHGVYCSIGFLFGTGQAFCNGWWTSMTPGFLTTREAFVISKGIADLFLNLIFHACWCISLKQSARNVI